jgi:hypothetical protein
MLGKIFKLCDNIINLDANKIVINVIFKDEVRSFILDLNRINQLYDKGEDIQGDVIGEYSRFTEEITKGRKKAGAHYTLYDTGAFYKSFDVAVYSDDSFTIEADSIKEDGTDLTRKFGKGILGLSSESKGKLVEKIIPLVIVELRKQIF